MTRLFPRHTYILILLLFSDAIADIEHSDSVYDKMADIYAIGFQEIVDLNAQNIVAASSDNAKACNNSKYKFNR